MSGGRLKHDVSSDTSVTVKHPVSTKRIVPATLSRNDAPHRRALADPIETDAFGTSRTRATTLPHCGEIGPDLDSGLLVPVPMAER
jgi:hypothetical protein